MSDKWSDMIQAGLRDLGKPRLVDYVDICVKYPACWVLFARNKARLHNGGPTPSAKGEWQNVTASYELTLSMLPPVAQEIIDFLKAQRREAVEKNLALLEAAFWKQAGEGADLALWGAVVLKSWVLRETAAVPPDRDKLMVFVDTVFDFELLADREPEEVLADVIVEKK